MVTKEKYEKEKFINIVGSVCVLLLLSFQAWLPYARRVLMCAICYWSMRALSVQQLLMQHVWSVQMMMHRVLPPRCTVISPGPRPMS
jgi:hypothetical protein